MMLDETLLGSIEGLCAIFISLEQDSESLIPLILFFFTRTATMRFEVALFLHGLFSSHSQIGTNWEKMTRDIWKYGSCSFVLV